MTTTTHTARCIENALTVIEENNLDTLVERGINDRLTALSGDWFDKQQLIDGELEAGYAAGTLSQPSEELAAQWLAEGIITCRCHD